MTLVQSRDDKKAMQILESTTRKVGNRYETGLLWKSDDIVLPNNKVMAEKRLESLERRLNRDPDLKVAYEKTFLGDVDKGYARLLSNEELDTPVNNQCFLPQHPVLNPNKPGKVRRVFDGTAKYEGISLNDCLLTGPNLLNSLVGVLMRFREEPISLSADRGDVFTGVSAQV
jgi:hypothetical protein